MLNGYNMIHSARDQDGMGTLLPLGAVIATTTTTTALPATCVPHNLPVKYYELYHSTHKGNELYKFSKLLKGTYCGRHFSVSCMNVLHVI